MTALDEARSFFEGTTERPLDYTEALAWDLFEQYEDAQATITTLEIACDHHKRFWQKAEERERGLKEQLETTQRERDEWAREFKRVQDIGLANAAETAALINAEMEEQLEAQREALERARYWLRAYGHVGDCIEEIDAALAATSNPASEPCAWCGSTRHDTEYHASGGESIAREEQNQERQPE